MKVFVIAFLVCVAINSVSVVRADGGSKALSRQLCSLFRRSSGSSGGKTGLLGGLLGGVFDLLGLGGKGGKGGLLDELSGGGSKNGFLDGLSGGGSKNDLLDGLLDNNDFMDGLLDGVVDLLDPLLYYILGGLTDNTSKSLFDLLDTKDLNLNRFAKGLGGLIKGDKIKNAKDKQIVQLLYVLCSRILK